MGIFSGKKKKPQIRRPRNRYTPEEQGKRYAQKRILEMARDNPEIERAVIRQYMNIDVGTPDTSVEERKKIDNEIYRLAREKLANDPNLSGQIAEAKLRQMVNVDDYFQDGEGGLDYYGRGSDLENLLNELDMVDALNERLGRNGGKGGFNGETLMTILQALAGIMGQNQNQQQPNPPPQQQRMYVIEIDGRPQPVTEMQYQAMLRSGQIKPIALASGQPSPPPPPERPAPVQQTEPEIPVEQEPTGQSDNQVEEVLSKLNLSKIADAIEAATPPEDFVDDLVTDIYNETETSESSDYVYGFLSSISLNHIVTVLGFYQEHPTYGQYVTILMSEEGREWLGRVIEIIQSGQAIAGEVDAPVD